MANNNAHHPHHHGGAIGNGANVSNGAQTNGASLEDCHSNFFALTDVCGIRWVVYREQENPQTLDPAEDAILQSYAKCLEAELLAVWRRIPNRPTHDSGGGGGPGPGGTAAVKRCNKDGGKNLLTQRKELWVFWYGDKPPADADQQLLKRLVSPQLKEADISGTWENNGLPYEARTLLYKALNNLIERNLLKKGFVRLGKWFVQPFEDASSSQTLVLGPAADHEWTTASSTTAKSRNDLKAAAAAAAMAASAAVDSSCQAKDLPEGPPATSFMAPTFHLSFSFQYFMHGESCVCASVDVRHHPAVKRLSPRHLLAAKANNSNGHDAVPVILAPYGLAATLTGATFKQSSSKLLAEWSRFFPIPGRRDRTMVVEGNKADPCSNSAAANFRGGDTMPAAVEVLVAGVRLAYPTCYVLVTDYDAVHRNGGAGGGPSRSLGRLASSGHVLRSSLPTLDAEEGRSRIRLDAGSNCFGLEPSPFTASVHPLLTDGMNVPQYSSVSSSDELEAGGGLVAHVWKDGLLNPRPPNFKENVGTSSSEGTGSAGKGPNNNISSSSSKLDTSLALWDFASLGQVAKKRPRSHHHKNRDRGRPFSSKVPFHRKFGTLDELAWSLQANLVLSGGNAEVAPVPPQHHDYHQQMGPASGPHSVMVPPPMGMNAVVRGAAAASSGAGGPVGVASNPPTPKAPGSVPTMAMARTPGSVPAMSPCSMPPLSNGPLTPMDDSAAAGKQSSVLLKSTASFPKVTVPVPASSAGVGLSHLSDVKSPTMMMSSSSFSGFKTEEDVGSSKPPYQAESQARNSDDHRLQTRWPQAGSLKRPALPFKDYEADHHHDRVLLLGAGGGSNGGAKLLSRVVVDPTLEDGVVPMSDALYDSESMKHWLDHPVKKFRSSSGSGYLVDGRRTLGNNGLADQQGPPPRPLYRRRSQCDPQLSFDLFDRSTVDSDNHYLSTGSGVPGAGYSQHNGLTSTVGDHDNKIKTEQLAGTQQLDIGYHHSSIDPMIDYMSGEDPHDQSNRGVNAGVRKEVMNKAHEEDRTDLYTSQGLKPSMEDLDNMFESDESDGNGMCPTPPDSNKPEKMLEDSSSLMEGIGASSVNVVGANCGNNASGLSSNNIGSVKMIKSSLSRLMQQQTAADTNLPANDQLAKMFPTPPSHEHNPIASPADGTSSSMEVDGHHHHHQLHYQQQHSIGNHHQVKAEPMADFENFSGYDAFADAAACSGLMAASAPMTVAAEASDLSEDSSVSIMLASAKYAPLPKLFSDDLPALEMPSYDIRYKPAGSGMTVVFHDYAGGNHACNVGGPAATLIGSSKHLLHHHHHHLDHHYPQQQQQQQQQTHQQNVQQASSAPPSNRTASLMSPMSSPMLPPSVGEAGGGYTGGPRSHHSGGAVHHVASPASSSGYKNPMSVGRQSQQQQQQQLHQQHQQQHQYQHPLTPSSASGTGGGVGGSSSGGIQHQVLPEANGLALNLVLSDSLLNVFRDHNFDSCTMCVCSNEGNICGRDAAKYVPKYSDWNEDCPGCICGFSAVINRKLAYRSGLFYEDEAEVTNILLPLPQLSRQALYGGAGDQLKKLQGSGSSRSGSGVGDDHNQQLGKDASSAEIDAVPAALLDLLHQQFSLALTSPATSSLDRCSDQHLRLLAQSSRSLQKRHPDVVGGGTGGNGGTGGAGGSSSSMIELMDSNFVIFVALEQVKNSSATADSAAAKIDESLKGTCVHRWTFLHAPGPYCSEDVMRVMKALQPLLNASLHIRRASSSASSSNSVTTSMAVQGPLTWRQFHRMAGATTKGNTDDQCEPLPVPLVTVGHEKDFVAVSPLALPFWETLSLEPFSASRDVAYIVVAPENDYLNSRVRTFFKNLSNTYELCKLGRHVPITNILRDGILKVGKKYAEKLANSQTDHWFELLGDSPTANLLKLYSQVCRQYLLPILHKLSLDRSLIESSSANQRPQYNHQLQQQQQQQQQSGPKSPCSSSMPPPASSMPMSLGGGLEVGGQQGGGQQQGIVPSTEDVGSFYNNKENGGVNFSGDNGQGYYGYGSSSSSAIDDSSSDNVVPPAVVIYMVDPFGFASTLWGSKALSGLKNGPPADQAGLDHHHHSLAEAGFHPGQDNWAESPGNRLLLSRLTGLGMLRSFSQMLPHLGEVLRQNIHLQIVSLESIVESCQSPLGRAPFSSLSSSSVPSSSPASRVMKGLSFSVYSQLRRTLQYHQRECKTLTGFGPASSADKYLKSTLKTKLSLDLYCPPFILAAASSAPKKRPLGNALSNAGNESSTGAGSSGCQGSGGGPSSAAVSAGSSSSAGAASSGAAAATSAFSPPFMSVGLATADCGDQRTSVLFCNYFLSEDQHWLLAACSDDRGELVKTAIINIEIPNKARRKKASARRIGLRKLMDWVIGLMTTSLTSWRLVIGRVGRIGHSELRGWSVLLSRKSLKESSKQLRDMCCWQSDVPCILSACLVSLEPDSNLRLFSDQFTPDERFGQTASSCQLATPRDASCTHILVIPISAKAQSSQKAFEDNPEGLSSDPFDFDIDLEMPEDGMGDLDDLRDLFNDENWGGDPEPPQSPGGSKMNSASQPGSPGGNHSGQDHRLGDHFRYGQEESGERIELLQQPLALGYLVSTAPTGPMPRWFWSSCPHLEHVSPVFLKAALHINVASIMQGGEDGFTSNNQSGSKQLQQHSLDSSYTSDVLRYVLEGYNALSWLSVDAASHDRRSCLPLHMQMLLQMYNGFAAFM